MYINNEDNNNHDIGPNNETNQLFKKNPKIITVNIFINQTE
jgi:hypothetical protein